MDIVNVVVVMGRGVSIKVNYVWINRYISAGKSNLSQARAKQPVTVSLVMESQLPRKLVSPKIAEKRNGTHTCSGIS